MNNKDECTCDHPKSGHFESTGRCAVIVCHCQGYETKPPFFLPHFEVDENTTWKRLLGELTFEVAYVVDQMSEIRERAVTRDEFSGLTGELEENEQAKRKSFARYQTDVSKAFGDHGDRLAAIEEQLPTFKKTRKGKKAKK